jgi:hypothetical protein
MNKVRSLRVPKSRRILVVNELLPSQDELCSLQAVTIELEPKFPPPDKSLVSNTTDIGQVFSAIKYIL